VFGISDGNSVPKPFKGLYANELVADQISATAINREYYITIASQAGHTNMMMDGVVANLQHEALRLILRGILSGELRLTAKFNSIVTNYLTDILKI
jgi:hypothetical protein